MSKICFVVGHGKSKSGGYDSGATNGNYHEFKIAREIAKYAQAYYNANYSEQCDLMNYNGDLYLTDRIKKINTSDYSFIAEFHLNAGGGTGTECYYFHGSDNCKKYATAICANISSVFNIRNRGAKVRLNSNGKDYFGIIRDTKPTAVLIETVFIDTSDLEKVKTASGQKACGEAIAKAVASVRGAKAKTSSTASSSTASSSTASSSYYKKYTGVSSSLVDALKAIGVNSAYSYRKKIAKANGISNYLGTASQNTKLLNLLKQGKLKKA